MQLQKNWIALGFIALMSGPLAHTQEMPPTSDIEFDHPVLNTANVSAQFGVRTNPFTKKPSWHGGVDLGAPWDDPIYAPAEGVVVFAGTKAGWGKRVDLKVSDSWVLRFAHLKAFEVSEGDQVSSGDVLGIIGSTGRATGPHVHLEALYNGKRYNPQDIQGLTLYATARSASLVE
jgi:murein DD-endopeptidase MepM/ murein hydrolase activator NlpD